MGYAYRCYVPIAILISNDFFISKKYGKYIHIWNRYQD